jgi:hypothetical protein
MPDPSSPESSPPAGDAWARLTPYELGIPGRAFAEENFAAIAREAEARGVDPSDPGAFMLLGEVGRVLNELQGGERGADALQRFGAFLFHAWHMHRAGEPLLLLERETVRHLVEGWPGAPADWEGALPAEAGYLQLPRHLVWTQPDPEAPPEDLDGIFWVRSAGETLSLMAALGVRPDRPGLSVVPLPPFPLKDAPGWLDAKVRDEGEGVDFETTLPGGELDRLYSLVAAGELLKLAARAFAHIDRNPSVLGAEERAPRQGEGSGADERARPAPQGTRPSLLPFRRIG